jgi:uncharacterized protein YdaU (DUF1376 family)
MAEFPALPLFTDAYLADTIHLTAAQHGAYILLLMAAWRLPDCALPNDDKFLAKIARMDKRTWEANKAVVLSFWTLGPDAKLRQGRLLDERKFAEQRRDRQSQAGQASALKRKERGSKTLTSGSNQNPTPTPTPTPIKKGGSPLPPETAPPEPRGVGALRLVASENKAKASRWAEFRTAYPNREGGQGWPNAERKYVALVASGIPEEVIISGARRYAEHLKATGKIGTQYVKQASTWLNQKGWEDEYHNGTGRRQQSDLMDTLDRHRREAEARAGYRAPGQGDGPSWDIDATATEI